jgi:hypothetical protein
VKMFDLVAVRRVFWAGPDENSLGAKAAGLAYSEDHVGPSIEVPSSGARALLYAYDWWTFSTAFFFTLILLLLLSQCAGTGLGVTFV